MAWQTDARHCENDCRLGNETNALDRGVQWRDDGLTGLDNRLTMFDRRSEENQVKVEVEIDVPCGEIQREV